MFLRSDCSVGRPPGPTDTEDPGYICPTVNDAHRFMAGVESCDYFLPVVSDPIVVLGKV